ncbi:MAG: hypothetical protein SO072_02425 [Dysosmobacter sp.]|nr:hypothetical protein [Dysosmobacter sp.]
MQLKNKLSLVLACVISICCLNVDAVATGLPSEGGIIEIEQGIMRASKTFNVEVSAYGNANANAKDAFSMEAGETVRFRATYSPEDASVDFGLIDSDGIFHYVNVTDGSIDQTIKITEADNYRLGIRNNSGSVVKVTGFVRY